MITPAYVAEMARYNVWQNEVVYGLCDDLSDEERKRDRGMFFGSLHHTLDHIAMLDQRILDYLVDQKMLPFEPRRIVHEDWQALKQARKKLDRRIAALAEEHNTEWLEDVIEVQSDYFNRLRRIPHALYIMQMFNHQTHHRSQVTTELHKLGLNYGGTDIPFNPQSPY